MDIIAFLTQDLWYGFQVWHAVLLGIVVLFIIIYRKRKQLFAGKEKEYKEIILKDEITEEVKDILNVAGKKIFKEKRLLRIGYSIIGRITNEESIAFVLVHHTQGDSKYNSLIPHIFSRLKYSYMRC